MVNSSRPSFHSTTTQASAKEKNESQGHVKDPSNAHKKDPQSQAAQSGEKARSPSNQALDAASPHEKQKPQEIGGGNKEGIGFVDQVGGQSASARHFEEKGTKNTLEDK
ncbi:hypothetical protein BDZ94DRAFT_1157837 [Collybia nuda]|uniref:Uncharacterized protein n=1 Tax=Collybia nuda TaxID=64659 RepID=A0A9P5YAB9_9AGAR|nr:hypothetical protein BDZ94DRAFT_1157837 [Collybia nuda]